MKIILSAIVLIVCFQTKTFSQELSYDGYYVATPDQGNMSIFKYYLRFYSDGTVISVTTAGKPENLLPWFKKENKVPSRGKYTLTDSTINFSMQSEQGEVIFNGVLRSTSLVLKVKSNINKYEAKELYEFMRIENIK